MSQEVKYFLIFQHTSAGWKQVGSVVDQGRTNILALKKWITDNPPSDTLSRFTCFHEDTLNSNSFEVSCKLVMEGQNSLEICGDCIKR